MWAVRGDAVEARVYHSDRDDGATVAHVGMSSSVSASVSLACRSASESEVDSEGRGIAGEIAGRWTLITHPTR